MKGKAFIKPVKVKIEEGPSSGHYSRLFRIRNNSKALAEFTSVQPFIFHNSKFNCIICKQTFIEKSDMRNHFSEHSLQDSIKSIESSTFYSKSDRVFKVDVSEIKCTVCDVTLSDLTSIMEHLQATHNKTIDPTYINYLIPFNLSSEVDECCICKKHFSNMNALAIHMKEHFRNFSCEICGKAYKTAAALYCHNSAHEEGSFHCEQCGKVFPTRMKFITHTRHVHVHTLNRACKLCPARFNSVVRLAKHKQKEHGIIPEKIKCEFCETTFYAAHVMRAHVRTVHLKEKPFKCAECDQTFGTKYCLTEHNVIHTGQRDFNCTVCSKTFARKKNLVQHMRTHDIDKFVCSICSQGFSQKCSLINHTKSRHATDHSTWVPSHKV